MLKRFLSVVLALTMLASSCVTVMFAEEQAEKGQIMVKGLQVEYLTNPIGIDVESPRLSWYSESSTRGTMQKNYRITMATSAEKLSGGNYDIWDSGTVTSDVSTGIVYSGPALPKKTRIYWQVTVTDQKGNTATSQPSYFETGLMDGNWSGAQWITNSKDAIVHKNKSFTITVDFKIINKAAGVFFGSADADNMYMWQFKQDSNGTFIVLPHKKTDGSWSYPGGWAGTPAGDWADVTERFATMKIVVNEGKITTYLNDVQIVENDLDAFAMGNVGFRQSGSEEAEFDNFKVTDGDGTVLFESDFSDANNKLFVAGTLTESGTLTVTKNEYNYAIAEEAVKENVDNRPNNPHTNEVNDPAPMFRKEFSTSGTVKDARLYITSAGNYDAYINGKPVTDSFLNPGRSDYKSDLKYQAFDVTELIVDGDNAIGAFVGHGWYSTKFNNYGTKFALMALLEIKYADGSVQTVVTDDSWTSYNDGPIQYEDLMNGVTFDSTKVQEGWSEGGFDDGEWNAVTLTTADALKVSAPYWTRVPLIRVGDVFAPVEVTNPQSNMVVYDFGVNFSGIPYIKVKGEAGQKIMFRYGELLNSEELTKSDGEPGSVYRGNLTDAQATDYYVLSGDPDGEIFYPKMTTHGFRYMECVGVNFTITEANLLEVEGHALYSDLDRTGYFESSDELVNQLYENSYRSNVSNFMGIPTDCPQRGERTGWTADAQVYSRTASFNLNTFAFLEEYAFNLTKAQRSNGTYPEAAPTPVWNAEVENGWGDAGVIIPWTMYLAYGDTKILEDNYEGMTRWIDAFIAASNSDYERNDEAKYGDWLAVEATPAYVTNNAYSAYVTGLVSKIAAVLGKDDEAENFADIAEKFRQAFVRVCTDGNGRTLCNTQTSYVLGLAFDLFDEEDRVAAERNLANRIAMDGCKITTGFLGVNFLNPVLSDIGRSDLAYTLLLRQEYPSWLYPVTLGATTTFECWDGLKETADGKISTRGSLNHYSYGSISEWMYRYMLGIDLDENNPGYKHIILHPETNASFSYAKGSYMSQYGQIVSEWKFEGDNTVYNITVPANTTATLTLAKSAKYRILESGINASDAEGVVRLENNGSDAVFELTSGSFTFTVVGNAPGAEPELKNAIKSEGFSARIKDYTGLRAIFSFDRDVAALNEQKGYTLDSYGVIASSYDRFISTYRMDEDALFVDARKVTDNTGPIKFITIYNADGSGENRYIDYDTRTFCISLINIESEHLQSDVYMAGYAIWIDEAGNESYTITTYSMADGEKAVNLYEITLGLTMNGLINSENTDDVCFWQTLKTGALKTNTFNTANDSTPKGYTLSADGYFTYCDVDWHEFTGDTTNNNAWSYNPSGVSEEASGLVWSVLKYTDNEYVMVYRNKDKKTYKDLKIPMYTENAKYYYYAPYDYRYGSTAQILSGASLKTYNPALTQNDYEKIKTVVVDHGISGTNTGGFSGLKNVQTIVYPNEFGTASHVFSNASSLKNLIWCHIDENGDPVEHMSEFEGLTSLIDTRGLTTLNLNSTFSGAAAVENVVVGNTSGAWWVELTFNGTNALKRVWPASQEMPEEGVLDATQMKFDTLSKGVFNVGSSIKTIKLSSTINTISTGFKSSDTDNRLWSVLGQNKSIDYICDDDVAKLIANYVAFVRATPRTTVPATGTYADNITVNGKSVLTLIKDLGLE